MTTILAFEASGEQCSVTLSINDQMNTLMSDQPRAHASHLLPFTEQLLAQAHITLSDVDAIACAVGPGSFTGLRIALSVAQGLAYASDKPIISINSLAAMSASLSVTDSHIIVPLVDARMDEVYWGAYDTQSQSLGSAEAYIGSRNSFEAELKALLASINDQGLKILAVGKAWQTIDFAQAAANALAIDLAPTLNGDEASSAYVAALAINEWNKGHSISPQNADLYYCRDSVAWNKRTRIRSR